MPLKKAVAAGETAPDRGGKVTYLFTALRFFEDENICDRTYWYRCDFPVEEGALVLAPVGSRNGLQLARVERTLSSGEADAPYDLRLIKRAEAKYGARKLVAGRLVCYELGGVRYDEKRFTRFRRVLFCSFGEEPSEEERALLASYGVTETVRARALCDVPAEGCVLLTGENARSLAEELLSLVRANSQNPLAQRLR